jgi:hypothetical protein
MSVHARDDAYRLAREHVVDGKWEASQQRPATIPMHDREALRHTLDLGQRHVDGAQEIGAKASRATLVPKGGIGDISLCG